MTEKKARAGPSAHVGWPGYPSHIERAHRADTAHIHSDSDSEEPEKGWVMTAAPRPRKTFILLSAAIAASLIAGCGSSETDDLAEELRTTEQTTLDVLVDIQDYRADTSSRDWALRKQQYDMGLDTRPLPPKPERTEMPYTDDEIHAYMCESRYDSESRSRSAEQRERSTVNQVIDLRDRTDSAVTATVIWSENDSDDEQSSEVRFVRESGKWKSCDLVGDTLPYESE